MVPQRKFLLPISLLYGLITQVRNILYDKEILKSTSFEIPVITVGNLSVGGTGKTPMIEYLLDLLTPNYSTATLSRGYGRKTKGYLEVTGREPAESVGDEPLQFKLKYPLAIVAVEEDRRRGIANLIAQYRPEVVLLDDAFQHRKVKACLNIILSSYDKIYVEDYLLPAGNLRESRGSAARADVVVITKCPKSLGANEQAEIKRKLQLEPQQQLFFSYIKYADCVLDKEGNKLQLEQLKGQSFTLVTGIARPEPLVKYLKNKNFQFDHLKFPDHHNFSSKDLQNISGAEIVLTTEKDFMRLKNSLSHSHLYYLPIKTEFLNRASDFDAEILKCVKRK